MCFIPKGRKKYVTPYTDPATGKKRKKTWTADKTQSERMEAQFLHELYLRRHGLVDPAAERFAAHERTPLSKHIDDYVKRLEGKGRDPKHVRTTRLYINRVITEGRIQSLSGLTSSIVEDALIAIGDRGRRGKRYVARTFNGHLTAIKAFGRWAWLQGRARSFDLGAIERRNEESDRSYIRRLLSDDELRTLIHETRNAPIWRGISGMDRSWFYLVASVTGFRRSELGELRPENFAFDGDIPFIGLPGKHTKSGRDAAQPIAPKIVEELRPWLFGKATGEPVFALPEKTAAMMRFDLTRCGVQSADQQGHVVDTHSLRHGFITALARDPNVPQSAVTLLARHCDPKTTFKVYTHLKRFDLLGSVQPFANLMTAAERKTLAATGTDGPCATQPGTQVFSDGCNMLHPDGLQTDGGRLLISGL